MTAWLLAWGAAVSSLSASPFARPNVLLIAADDLRCDLGAYGNREVITPNLDALAARGTVFLRAYTQQAVCNPSRASMLTGRRPDTIRVWDLRAHFRDALPEVVTLPQHFKNHGYRAVGLGKIYHNQSGTRRPTVPFSDPASWSETPRFAEGAHWQDWVMPGSPGGPKDKRGAVQCLDVPDEAYFDGQIAAAACAKLGELKQAGEPFFLAVGFWKPHLPFNAPKKYWDLYDRDKLSVPLPKRPPAGAPALAGHDSWELRNYKGVPTGPISPAQAAELRHGYFAAVSFLDAQVGKVLAELRRQGLEENTIVVFWSDHGFHLGEHALWGKSTNYELDARAPLILAAPGAGQSAGRVTGLVEFIDLYPTLVELCALPVAEGLEGDSLVPRLKNPAAPGKPYALSQHPRPYFNNELTQMGYTLRSDRHRYVEWRERASGGVVATELYAYDADLTEKQNLVNDPTQATTLATLRAELARRIGPASPGPN